MSDLRIAIAGHVDHGKSTLIGRLLYDTGSLADGKAEEIVASSARRGLATEWSFAVDASQEERDQAITIETTRVWMHYAGRRIVIIDTPGHREFIKNMMSGAADADAAILVIDAQEGIRDQTYRHAYLLQLLDVPEIVVAINKIDAVDDAHAVYTRLEGEIREVLAASAQRLRAVVPISARDGDNVVTRSATTTWYTGPTLIDVVVDLEPATPAADRDLRVEIADVYRFTDERVAAGNVLGGTVAAGDRVRIAPSGAVTTVRAVKRWPEDGRPAVAGEAIGLTFDDPVFLDRGDVVAHADAPAPTTSSHVSGVFFWLSAEGPRVGETLLAKIGRTEVAATVIAIEESVDLGVLDHIAVDASPRHTAFGLRLRLTRIVVAERHGRVALVRNGETVAGGKLAHVEPASRAGNVVPHGHLIAREERALRNGYRGVVAWFTGLPGSGKSTLAMAVERELFARGYFVYVLDGDNVRSGLNGDLGFSRADREENVRRVGQVAALFADAGAIVLASTISPHADDRRRAREAARGAFREIYVRASLATCEARDVKGHYRRARAGEIPEFTGVSAPYDVPESPDLVVDTERTSLEECVHAIVDDLVRASALSSDRNAVAR